MRAFVVGNYMNAHFLNVPRLPRAGETIAATGVFHEHGGKGLNLAVGLRRLGAQTQILMTVGRDDPGASVTSWLAASGVDVSHVHAVDAPSGYGVGFVAQDGSNMLVPYLGANTALDASHVESAARDIAQCDWTLAQFEAPDRAILPAFALARQAGRRTYLNAGPCRPFDARLEALIDVLAMNESEAAGFFDRPDLDGAPRARWGEALRQHPRALGWSGRWLVVTLGERGAMARRPDGAIVEAPGYAIAQLDATGAGDAFGAGLVLALHEGHDDPLRFANACGAMVARRQGVLAALPQRADVEAFRREAGGSG